MQGCEAPFVWRSGRKAVVVFSSLTFPTRQLLIGAREEARALGRDYVGSEHLLLAILREPNAIVARTVGRWATVDQVRMLVRRTRSSEAVERTFTDAVLESVPSYLRERVKEGKRTLPFTRVVVSTVSAAAGSGDWRGVEHVLLALLQTDSSDAVGILKAAGCPIEEVRRELAGAIEGP